MQILCLFFHVLFCSLVVINLSDVNHLPFFFSKVHQLTILMLLEHNVQGVLELLFQRLFKRPSKSKLDSRSIQGDRHEPWSNLHTVVRVTVENVLKTF